MPFGKKFVKVFENFFSSTNHWSRGGVLPKFFEFLVLHFTTEETKLIFSMVFEISHYTDINLWFCSGVFENFFSHLPLVTSVPFGRRN